MKSLKRTLSLVLVLVMVLGLFGGLSINAAALTAEFTDGEEVQYDEAVDVMTGIGAIDGMGDGTFNPKGTITRAQAAKLVTYAVLGKAAAERLPAGVTSRFSDVGPEYAWAAPSIEYLVNKGVINGMGDGTFHPGEPITGFAIGKMLLCCLGYGAKDEYVGAGWDLQVAIDGSVAKTGIFAGRADDANLLRDNASREEVALYCFNTIMAKEVEYVSSLDMYVGKTDTLGSNVYLTIRGEIYNGGKDGGLNPGNSTDAVGRPVSTWKYLNNTIHEQTKAPIVRYTTAVTAAKIEKDVKNAGYGLGDTGNYKSSGGAANDSLPSFLLYNGVDTVVNQIANADEVKYDDIAYKTGTGIVTEIYGNALTHTVTNVVQIATHLGKVTSIAEDGESMTINVTYETAGASATIKEFTIDKSVDGYAEVYAMATGLIAAGQNEPPVTVVVKYNVSGTSLILPTTGGHTYTLLSVGVPQTEEGKVSKVVKNNADSSALTFIAGDKNYTISSMAYNKGIKDKIDIPTKPTVKVIMDADGYVLDVKDVESEPPAVGLVTAVGEGDSEYGSATVKMKLLTATGEETEIVVSKVTIDGSEQNMTKPNDLRAALVRQAVTYTPATGVNAGKFEVSKGTEIVGATNATIVTGQSKIQGTGGTVYANSETTYIVLSNIRTVGDNGGQTKTQNIETYDKTIYTGVSNSPSMTGVTFTSYVYGDNATVVYVTAGEGAGLDHLAVLAMDIQHKIRDGATQYYKGALITGEGEDNQKEVFVPISLYEDMYADQLYGTWNDEAPSALTVGTGSPTKAEFKTAAIEGEITGLAENDTITVSIGVTDTVYTVKETANVSGANDVDKATLTDGKAIVAFVAGKHDTANDDNGDATYDVKAVNGALVYTAKVAGDLDGTSSRPSSAPVEIGIAVDKKTAGAAAMTFDKSVEQTPGTGVSAPPTVAADLRGLDLTAIAKAAKDLTGGTLRIAATASNSDEKLHLMVGTDEIGVSTEAVAFTSGAKTVTMTFTTNGQTTGTALGSIKIDLLTAASYTNIATDMKKITALTAGKTEGVESGLTFTPASGATVVPFFVLNTYSVNDDDVLVKAEGFKNTGSTIAEAGLVKAGPNKEVIILEDATQTTSASYTFDPKSAVWEIELDMTNGGYKATAKPGVNSVVSSTDSRLAVTVRSTRPESITAVYILKLDSTSMANRTAIIGALNDMYAAS